MIPRFAPTYTCFDLFRAIFAICNNKSAEILRHRLAMYYNVRHVFLFERARVALYALLKAYNRPGGVLMPAYNCIVVPEAVNYAGYYPAFVDIDRYSLNMSVDAVTRNLTPKISVVLATHLFGIPCDVKSIRDAVAKSGTLVVEDAAAALGARYQGSLVGTVGDAAIFSFHSTKSISGEEGGALLLNDDKLAQRVKRFIEGYRAPSGEIRRFVTGLVKKTITRPWIYSCALLGYKLLRNELMYEVVSPQKELSDDFLRSCSKFSNALILKQLGRMEGILRKRNRTAQIYQEELSNLSWVSIQEKPVDSIPAWIQFPIQVRNKNALYKYMQQNDVDLTWTYRYSCADSYGLNGFPKAREAAKMVLGLPTHTSLSEKQAMYICRIIRQFPLSKLGKESTTFPLTV
jgi:perosamine synthetase